MRSGLCCVALAFVVSAVLRVGSSEEGGEITSALLEVNNAQLHLEEMCIIVEQYLFVFRTTWYNFTCFQFFVFIGTFALPPRHVVDDV